VSYVTAVAEFRTDWLPHVTDAALARVIDLLERVSPLLIHGAFDRATSQGCLATHIAWNHPATCDESSEAGILWLTRVARLNPATSQLLLAWDRHGLNDWSLREALLVECRAEMHRRLESVVCCNF
jgi:hypothetical protein